MLKQFVYPFSLIILILLFYRCAQIVALSGGKSDITPPKLLEAIPVLNTKNFDSEIILFKFDEIVQLKDLTNQLSICPRLKTDLEVSASGKQVEIRLKKEELKPNTTYRIYLGKAIADMTESNSIPNFDYVFSTGNEIDTLHVSGSISDAFTNESSSSILIGLYTQVARGDSLPYLEKPDYYTQSDENGTFELKSLPKGTYKIFGVADKNKNGTYDGESEKIAFLNADLNLKSDTNIYLKLFQEEASKVFIKKSNFTTFGSVQIIFNKACLAEVHALDANQESKLNQIHKNEINDTLTFFYYNILDSLNLIVKNATSNSIDTLNLAIPTKKSTIKKLKGIELNTSMNQLNLNTELTIHFSNWMDTSSYSLSGLQVLTKVGTLVKSVAVKGHWIDISNFKVDYSFQEGKSYVLKIDTNTFYDIKRMSNDSLKFNFSVHQKSDYGKVRLNLLLNKKQAYVVQLLNEQNTVIKEKYFQLALAESNSTTIDFTDVLPGTYKVKLIYDDNKNQKWDFGNLMLRQLPEKVLIHSKQLKVLSDWEIEEAISIKD